ncbi:FAD-binding oxidoreductase [Sulfitobacter albidus]|uniref:FAD-binding oxidoreductase n=1 Tax=Sulfitobacter albidus TaxID=2829501 RepID=A0A975JEE5_9RHOB|nr:FAD-binding oxidoreductase [Sulfitobacter albidus]QUJ76721.1 FAD-binding oxidoreductase [Sulfitobacter albidus]
MKPPKHQPSIWAATAPVRVPRPLLKGAAETDLAVIGGGFTGLSAAVEAARRGHAVTVLEGASVGWGASGRNNGQVIPILTSAEPDVWVKRFGDAGRRMVDLIGNSANTLFGLAREFGMDAEAEQSGWMQPAHTPGRVKLIAKRVEAWQRYGFPAELRDANETRDLLGTDFWHGAMLNPTGGHINPLAFARGLAKAAEGLGAVIHEGARVTRYAREGVEWVITTPEGTLRARALILATNAYTAELVPSLAPRLARSLIPVVSWQMATQPLGDNLRAQIVPGRQAVSDTRGDLRFFRYDARNRMITGGAVMGRRNVEARVRAKAAANMAEAFPEMGVPEMTHVWSGYVGMTLDRFPRVHRIGPDGFAWMACNGRGVAFGTAMGRELARAVTGEDIETLALPLTEPAPFPMHGLVTRLAPTYLAWLKRADQKEI